MVHATGATKRLFDRDYDDFGDSYVEDTTPERLQSVMAKIDVKSEDTLDNFEIAKLEDEHFPDESPYGLFRTCKIYLDNCAIVDDPTTHIKDSSLDLLALELRFFGASVSRRLSNDVSHVMVDLSDKSRVAKLKKVRGVRQRKFHIVTEEWVRECMEEGNIVNERAFEPGLDS